MPEEASQLTLTISGVSSELRVLVFEGHEGLSQLFEFDVSFACEEALTLDDIVRKPAVLTLNVDTDAPRAISGIVSRIEEDNPDHRWSTYRLTIVPQAWLLLHRMDCRIFQTLTAPQIVENVLKGAGL